MPASRSVTDQASALPRPPQAVGLGLAAVIFLIAPISVLAPKGVAVLFAIAGVLSGVGRFRAVVERPPGKLVALLSVILFWAACSLIWTIDRGATLDELAILVTVGLGGLMLLSAARTALPEHRRHFKAGLVAGYIVGLLILAEELLSNGWLIAHLYPQSGAFYFNQGACTIVLLFWPVAIILTRAGRWRMAAGLFIATLGVISLSSSSASIVGCLGGAMAAIALWWRPKAALVVTQIVVAGGILFAPLIVRALPSPETLMPHYTAAMSGAIPRLVIWSYVADRIEERPLLGWGLNSSRLFSNNQNPGILDPTWDIISEPLPLHPHNAVLQWWLELGAVGAILFGLLLLLTIRGIGRSPADPPAKAAALGQLIAGVLIATVSYGIWQGWWMGALWLSAILTAGLLSEVRRAA